MQKEKLDQVIAYVKENYKLPCINLEFVEKDNLSLTESKVGGLPYLPEDYKQPEDKEGNLLYLLAQINCADLPANDIYPEAGLVQFWICDDDLMGLDFDAPDAQDTWRIYYYETIDPYLGEESVKARYKDDYTYMPLDKGVTYGLSFSEGFDSPLTSYELQEKYVLEAWNTLFPEEERQDYYDDFSDEEMDYIMEAGDFGGHKIGGYPSFTQSDPRREGEYETLLLQIDTDLDLMWGDSGIGNFFIQSQDKKTGNFTKALYNWDCY